MLTPSRTCPRLCSTPPWPPQPFQRPSYPEGTALDFGVQVFAPPSPRQRRHQQQQADASPVPLADQRPGSPEARWHGSLADAASPTAGMVLAAAAAGGMLAAAVGRRQGSPHVSSLRRSVQASPLAGAARLAPASPQAAPRWLEEAAAWHGPPSPPLPGSPAGLQVSHHHHHVHGRVDVVFSSPSGVDTPVAGGDSLPADATHAQQPANGFERRGAGHSTASFAPASSASSAASHAVCSPGAEAAAVQQPCSPQQQQQQQVALQRAGSAARVLDFRSMSAAVQWQPRDGSGSDILLAAAMLEGGASSPTMNWERKQQAPAAECEPEQLAPRLGGGMAGGGTRGQLPHQASGAWRVRTPNRTSSTIASPTMLHQASMGVAACSPPALQQGATADDALPQSSTAAASPGGGGSKQAAPALPGTVAADSQPLRTSSLSRSSSMALQLAAIRRVGSRVQGLLEELSAVLPREAEGEAQLESQLQGPVSPVLASAPGVQDMSGTASQAENSGDGDAEEEGASPASGGSTGVSTAAVREWQQQGCEVEAAMRSVSARIAAFKQRLTAQASRAGELSAAGELMAAGASPPADSASTASAPSSPAAAVPTCPAPGDGMPVPSAPGSPALSPATSRQQLPGAAAAVAAALSPGGCGSSPCIDSDALPGVLPGSRLVTSKAADGPYQQPCAAGHPAEDVAAGDALHEDTSSSGSAVLLRLASSSPKASPVALEVPSSSSSADVVVMGASSRTEAQQQPPPSPDVCLASQELTSQPQPSAAAAQTTAEAAAAAPGTQRQALAPAAVLQLLHSARAALHSAGRQLEENAAACRGVAGAQQPAGRLGQARCEAEAAAACLALEALRSRLAATQEELEAAAAADAAAAPPAEAGVSSAGAESVSGAAVDVLAAAAQQLDALRQALPQGDAVAAEGFLSEAAQHLEQALAALLPSAPAGGAPLPAVLAGLPRSMLHLQVQPGGGGSGAVHLIPSSSACSSPIASAAQARQLLLEHPRPSPAE